MGRPFHFHSGIIRRIELFHTGQAFGCARAASRQNSGIQGVWRKDMKKAFALLIVAVLLRLAMPAGADLCTFDDLLGNHMALPVGYQGFTWSEHFWYVDGVTYGAGYAPATVSPRNVAFNAYGYDVEVAAVSLFNFDGAYFTGGWKDGLHIDISGWRDGSMVESATVLVSSTAPTWVGLNWMSVDELRFHSYDGTPNPDYGGHDTYNQFAMDDFTYTIVPLPGAVLLAGMGLVCSVWRLKHK